MLIFSNEASGEEVSFKYYDFESDEVYNISEEIVFVSDIALGNAINPLVFNTSLKINVNSMMTEGWNWISLSVFSDDMSLDEILSTISQDANFIKGQSGYADYYEEFGWFGTLEILDNTSMFKLKMDSAAQLSIWAYPSIVDETIFTLLEGYNWIGYSSQVSVDLNTAFLNVPNGGIEYIKNQEGYADYYANFGFFGSLEQMNPFGGYIAIAASNLNFTYNEGGMSRISTMSDIFDDDYDLNIHDYEHNATMTSAIYIDDARVDSYDYVLSAHDGTKCVGYTEGLYFPLDGNIVFPLMVYGNEAGTSLTFKVYNKVTQTYLDIDEEFVFTPDMTLGDGFNPVTLNSLETPIEHSISAAYPNPFNPVVNFDIDLDGNHYVDARVYNLSGQEVAIIHDGMLSGNAQKLSWMAVNQSSGIYFIKVVVDGIIETNNKIILLK
jgi:hypothetical protein